MTTKAITVTKLSTSKKWLNLPMRAVLKKAVIQNGIKPSDLLEEFGVRTMKDFLRMKYANKHGKEKVKNVIVDTNIVFELLAENPIFLDEIDIIGHEFLFVSSVTVLETYYGMRKSEERQTKELFKSLNRVYIDKEIGKKAEEIMFEYRGYRPNLPDCLIAATCIVFNYQLYTLNVNDFDYIKGIQLTDLKAYSKKILDLTMDLKGIVSLQ